MVETATVAVSSQSSSIGACSITPGAFETGMAGCELHAQLGVVERVGIPLGVGACGEHPAIGQQHRCTATRIDGGLSPRD